MFWPVWIGKNPDLTPFSAQFSLQSCLTLQLLRVNCLHCKALQGLRTSEMACGEAQGHAWKDTQCSLWMRVDSTDLSLMVQGVSKHLTAWNTWLGTCPEKGRLDLSPVLLPLGSPRIRVDLGWQHPLSALITLFKLLSRCQIWFTDCENQRECCSTLVWLLSSSNQSLCL